jgi:predicted nucleotidyltransferase
MEPDAPRFASAYYIRKLIQSSKPAERYMPAGMAEALASTKTAGAESERTFYELVRYRLLSLDVSDILSVGEGLENRLKKALNEAYDTDSLILAAKTKRYTYARLSRILVQALLGITKEAYAEIERRKLRYARVLALNSRGAAFLNEVKKQGRAIPIISNVNSVAEGAPERLLLDFDIKAADLYSVLLGRPIAPNSDHVITPVMTPGSQPG